MSRDQRNLGPNESWDQKSQTDKFGHYANLIQPRLYVYVVNEKLYVCSVLACDARCWNFFRQIPEMRGLLLKCSIFLAIEKDIQFGKGGQKWQTKMAEDRSIRVEPINLPNK